MSEAASFTSIAPYYDELMKLVPYRMWVGYYLLLLSHQGVHPKTLLDICCGTGTVAELLSDEGFRLAGFDLSPDMIEQARQKASKKELDIRYEVQNAATADMGERYDAAYSFFDSLNNILDLGQLRSAFVHAYDHLLPGGSLVFDMNTAYAFEQRMFDQQHLRPGSTLRYKWQGDWDPETSEIKVDMLFWYHSQEFHEVHRQKAYDPAEIRRGLEDAGFEEIRTYHSYSLDPPRATSDRLHWTALRPS